MSETHSGALPGCPTPRRIVSGDMLSCATDQFNLGESTLAKKQRETKPARIPTKRQLAKWEQQKRLQRIALVVGVVFVVFVLSYVGYGYYTDELKPLSQEAIRVNDTVFDMGYYIEMLRTYGKGQDPNQLSEIADIVIGLIQSNELAKQGAQSLGVSIEAEEIDSELKRLGLPNDQVSQDIIGAQLLAGKLMTDYFSLQVPVTGDQVRAQAMFLESEKVAQGVINRLEKGEDFATIATELSLEKETQSRSGDLGWLPKGFTEILVGSKVPEEVAFSLEPGGLSQPVYDAEFIKNIGYWLIEVIEKKPEQGIQAKAMLLGSEEEVELVRAKLDLGEDFTALAKLHSQHQGSKENGGDLGWLKPGMINQVFDKVAFTLEPGKLSEPVRDDMVQTKGGYWLVKVLEKEANRQLEVETRELMMSTIYENWLIGLRETSTVENYIGQEGKAWALSRAFGERR